MGGIPKPFPCYPSGKIKISRHSGSVSDCYAAGEVCGSNFLGGLIGVNELAAAVKDERPFSFRDVEKKEGGVSRSYYDKNITGRSDTGKGTPKTTEEMMRRETFEGWDFDGIWAISEGESYPYFQ